MVLYVYKGNKVILLKGLDCKSRKNKDLPRKFHTIESLIKDKVGKIYVVKNADIYSNYNNSVYDNYMSSTIGNYHIQKFFLLRTYKRRVECFSW